MQRLSKILAKRGVASRRESETIIQNGKVKVNDTLITEPQFLVDEEKDIVKVNGKTLSAKEEPKVYFLLNKPKKYVCTSAKTTSQKRVIDLFRNLPYRLFTVGRLDKDTTGLLIVTNDGFFANKTIHPSSDVEKEYLVKVLKDLNHNDLLKISEGIVIYGKRIKPTFVKKVRKGTLKIGVKEGKKHEVRLLIKNANLKLRELKRIRLGHLTLGNVPEGSYRQLSLKELKPFINK